MKKLLILATLVLMGLATTAQASGTLRLLTWKGYAPQPLVEKFEKHPLRQHFPPFAGMVEIESHRYYGDGYQDVQHRRPSIENARKILDWNPVITMDESIDETLDYFLRDHVDNL